MKTWKKEDFKDKYIYIDSVEKQEKAERFFLNLGFKDRGDWNKTYNPTKNTTNYMYLNLEMNYFEYHNHDCSAKEIKYKELGIDNIQQEVNFSIF